MTTPGTSPEAIPEAEAASATPGAPVVADATVASDAAPDERRRRRRKLALLLFLLMVLSVFALIGGLYMVTRKPLTDLPIPGISNAKLPHYVFSVYGTSRPLGVAVSPSGDRIYVTESDGDRSVKVFDAKGNPVATLRPPKDESDHQPVYLALEPQSGDVYVSDRPSGTIFVYTRDGKFARAFKPKPLIVGWQPLGLAFSPQGDLWVIDLSSPFQRIEIFGLDGTLKKTLGQPNQFNFPNMVAFDARDNVYLTDSNNGRVVILDQSGKQLSTINRGVSVGDLGLPRGVAIDDTGRLYVVDATAHNVQIYAVGTDKNARPKYVGTIGEEGLQEGAFEYPNGVAVDSRARIYVTDRENNRVQVWSY